MRNKADHDRESSARSADGAQSHGALAAPAPRSMSMVNARSAFLVSLLRRGVVWIG